MLQTNEMTMLNIFESDYGGHICKIDLDKNMIEKMSEIPTKKNNTVKLNSNKNVFNDNVETIIILDVSGSMASCLRYLITDLLPTALESMGYDDKNITVITFGSSTNVYNLTPLAMRTCGINAGGGTYMVGAINKLSETIHKSTSSDFRILTVSDGELSDQSQTLTLATQLSKDLGSKFNIHSTAIRLFTSTAQPDTRGLASVLQLNNIGSSELVDCVCNSKTPKSEIVNLIENCLFDNLGSSLRIISNMPIFMQHPWSTPQKEFSINEGQNVFWMSNISDDTEIYLTNSNGSKFQITKNNNEKLNLNNFTTILKEKIDYYTRRLKILKVVNTGDNEDEINNIIGYFSELEKGFALSDATNIDPSDTSIISRIKLFKKIAERQSKSIAQNLAEIANQNKVSQLNSAQQAEYLRSASTSKNTINLAKRGLNQGFDFDDKAIKEVKQMRQHISELDDIDDTHHSVSFYCQSTTLDGIRTLCKMDDKTLESLGALEILQLINIVGVPADAVIGDFPDPKTYHVNNLMLGSFISMSDIMMTRQMKRPATDPFTKKIIANSIPFYDDDRIQQFLIKHAPNILEYTASLGMRNMIINIPNTYKYTIVDGLWWITRTMQEHKTEANIQLFIKFVHTYKTAVGSLFSYVPGLLKPMSEEDKNNNLSLYIGNNGVTNMMGPLIEIQNNEEKLKMVPDVLRALYSFEFYQVIRKFFKSDSDGHIKRKEMLDKLLGIDFNKHASQLPPLFESQKVPQHCGEYFLDEKIFSDLCKRIYWLDYICMMPKMFGLALKNDVVGLSNIVFSKENCEKELNITFDLNKFKIFCIVQSFIFDSLAARFDETTNKMKIEDMGNETRASEFVQKYIRAQYHSHYQSELAKQNKKEYELLTSEFVNKLVDSQNVDEFNNLLKNGLTKNHVSVIFNDTYREGFSDLKNKLFDPKIECPDRENKLKVLVLGSDNNGEPVYNNGNTIKIQVPLLAEMFNDVGCSELWEKIKVVYIDKSVHIYRNPNMPNRHSHSNTKPSYWAYGYLNLGEYFNKISKEEQDAYCKEHTHCCGIWDGKPYRFA